MRTFRFRAEAALQLRRREHDDALARLARMQSALALAQRGVDDAQRQMREADATMRQAADGSTTAHTLNWYRSWRVRLAAERHRRELHRRVREADVQHATKLLSVAHRRVKSLERLQELALAAWRREADREERKTMDALATARFTRRKELV